jgi:hypothetical protein
MGYGGVWVITGMGYDRFDCILKCRILSLINHQSFRINSASSSLPESNTT